MKFRSLDRDRGRQVLGCVELRPVALVSESRRRLKDGGKRIKPLPLHRGMFSCDGEPSDARG